MANDESEAKTAVSFTVPGSRTLTRNIPNHYNSKSVAVRAFGPDMFWAEHDPENHRACLVELAGAHWVALLIVSMLKLDPEKDVELMEGWLNQ